MEHKDYITELKELVVKLAEENEKLRAEIASVQSRIESRIEQINCSWCNDSTECCPYH